MPIHERNHPSVPEANDEAVCQEILDQWDEGWATATFPHFSTTSHWAYAKARLSVFRSSEEWLTIFELLVYYMGLGDYAIIVSAFGNRLRAPGYQDWASRLSREEHSLAQSVSERVRQALWAERSHIGRLARRFVPAPKRREVSNTHHTLFRNRLRSLGLHVPANIDEPNADTEWDPDPLDFEVELNGERRRFTFSPANYMEAGIALDKPLSGDSSLDRRISVLRMLAHYLPADQLFYPMDVLLSYVRRPQSLPLFLQLHDWCHPGINGIRKPSDSPCLRSLARAVAQHRPGLYVCPAEMVNTHWSRWPQFGG